VYFSFILLLELYFLIINFSIVSATLSLGSPNYSITKVYGPGFNITGWLNISFNNEPSDSFFNDSFKNLISLKEVLNRSPSYTYTCIPYDCSNNYKVIDFGTTSLQRDLPMNQDFLYGIRVSANNFNSVTGFSLDISSNALESELPQLRIDILDDGDYEWVPYTSSGSFNETKRYGCYNPPSTGSGVLTLTQFSNMIKLQPSPNLKIGATITKIQSVSGNANFTLEIRDPASGAIGTCNVNDVGFQSGDIECVPKIGTKNFTITKEGNFYVIISARQGSEGKYTINYKTNQSCGNLVPENFALFVKSGRYSQLGSYKINNTEIERATNIPSNIENKIISYMQNKYGTNCNEGCIIPIKISSNSSQTLSISNIQLFYTDGNIPKFSDVIYEINKSAPKINSIPQRLYLDKFGFIVPNQTGTYNFILKFNNSILLIGEQIEVRDVPIINYITPTETASAYPTQFYVSVSIPNNVTIIGYDWNFGDNSPTITTTINKSNHTYLNNGTYPLTVTVRDSRGFSSSKTFSINVTSPKGIINTTLIEINRNLQRINSDIQAFQNPFYGTAISSALKLQNVTNSVQNLTEWYNNSSNQESDYNRILTELLKINVPKSIIKTAEGKNFVYLTENNYIDMDIVSEIAGGNYSKSKEGEYKEAVAAWQVDNINIVVDFVEFSGEFGSEIKKLVKIFEVKTTIKNYTKIDYDYYLVIPEFQGIGFDKVMNKKKNFYYINIKNNPTISFYTTQNIDFKDLNIFIAPPINRLNIQEDTSTKEGEIKSKTLILVLIMGGVLIIALITYFILYNWYKKKYERHLFPNRNDLYNLAIYISNARRKGLSNSEISEHLKKVGWNSEQIRYIMKKYEGKNTGMPGSSFFERNKKIDYDKHKS
ncbi:MAG: PKD domain-containing protein, partial [Candidatus Pacearchaeota archaeon]